MYSSVISTVGYKYIEVEISGYFETMKITGVAKGDLQCSKVTSFGEQE